MTTQDLTHYIEEDISLFPGTPEPKIDTLASHENNGFQETLYRLTTHMGTHIDAPYHILPSGRTLDDFPISQFYGRAVCIHIEGAQQLDLDRVKALWKSERVDFILFSFGWDQHWKSENYMKNLPIIDTQVMEWCVEMEIKAIGIDLPSVDPIDSTELNNHHILLRNDVLIVENLTNLRHLPQHAFTFYAIPLNFRTIDGSPVRAWAEW